MQSYISKVEPERSLTKILPNRAGRNNTGRVTVRTQGGRQKRYYREVDWKRDKRGVLGKVAAIEYDPNRNVFLALVHYNDGEKRYILLPLGLKIGDAVVAGPGAEVKVGNALPIEKLPLGTVIHNIELTPGKGAQLARSAGAMATVVAKDQSFAHIKLPSGELRKIKSAGYATVGQLSNIDMKNRILGKAGRARLMGRRPTVRGTAQNPRSHPHGGGEGRSGEGMHPKTPQGKPARGNHTRKPKKHSNNMILQRRKK